ncbi:hypothetical protein A9C11_20615 [Pseudomonas citronellolis]|uniref:Transposase IS116/IS110/IS902 family protein n=1 Tax=Pseudomonas citronellolis TaxID=53408 RepID=A0A1A9KFD4_9PSED|nr:hypothetical protein A9C11_20615 [Pseudomonas citronellolis]
MGNLLGGAEPAYWMSGHELCAGGCVHVLEQRRVDIAGVDRVDAQALLGISKRGDKNLRRLLVQCARSYLQRVDRHQGALADWVRSLRERRHSNVVACALANKLARIVWAIAANHSEFEARPSVCSA